MTDVRLIDANSVCRSIVDSIRYTEEWIREAREQQDTVGLQYASNTYSSLISMLERIQNEPTIEVEPGNGWISVKDRLPEPRTWVLAYIEYPSPVFELERGIRKTGNIRKMFYDGFYDALGNYKVDDCKVGDCKVTHWQPLPKPPKGG